MIRTHLYTKDPAAAEGAEEAAGVVEVLNPAKLRDRADLLSSVRASRLERVCRKYMADSFRPESQALRSPARSFGADTAQVCVT